MEQRGEKIAESEHDKAGKSVGIVEAGQTDEGEQILGTKNRGL